MAKEIIMPKFGFTQEESEILEWLKQPGDQVDKGDPIAVVSTDKISMEVEAPESGTLDGIRYKAGDIVPVTEIIAFILQPGEEVPSLETAATHKADVVPAEPVPASSSQKEQSFMPSISPVAARLAQEWQVDASLITGSGKDGQVTKKDVEDFLASQNKVFGKPQATPAARRIAREKQIDLSLLKGSGPGGRVQATDVDKAKATPAGTTTSGVGISVLKEIPLIGMRRSIAQSMQRSMQEAPHMVLQVDVEMDAEEGLRKLVNQDKAKESGKISVTAVIVKAVAWALEENPIVNSRFTEEKIILYKDVHVGVATALENGLIVPVIKYANQKDLTRISTELDELARKAHDGKLLPGDLANGTFTISNLGMYGIDRFSAIINPPQSAILAVGRMNPAFLPDSQGQPVLRKIITFSLSADHRVMDGAQAAKFLNDLRNALQNLGDILK